MDVLDVYNAYVSANTYASETDISGNLETNYMPVKQYVEDYNSFSPPVVSVVGNGQSNFSESSGSAKNAYLNWPQGVAVDTSGNIYIADTNNQRIRKVDANGAIITIAGTGRGGYSGDGGLAYQARINKPRGITVDLHGNVYFTDLENSRIRRIDVVTGIITSIADSLKEPYGINSDKFGNIYVAERTAHVIRKYTFNLTTKVWSSSIVAGTFDKNGFSGDDGSATSARLKNPLGVAVDSDENIYITDTDNYRIRKVTKSDGKITTIAGSSMSGSSSTEFNVPDGICVDLTGNVYVVDHVNKRIQKISSSYDSITTISPSNSDMNNPTGIAIDASGNLYIADRDKHRIRKIFVNASQVSISTIAGVSQGGYFGDLPLGRSARLQNPFGVASDEVGNIYIADQGNHRIHKVNAITGVISRIAGLNAGYSGDGGESRGAALRWPTGVAIDSYGDIYIADNGNHRIRKITVSTGIITTIAGTGTASFSGDGELAINATFNYPRAVAVDKLGNIYIADRENGRVRKIDAITKKISTIISSLEYPDAIAVDSLGNVYVTNTSKNEIIMLSETGSSSSIITGLNYPRGITVDNSSNIYISNTDQIRKYTFNSANSTWNSSIVTETGANVSSGDGGLATSAFVNDPHHLTVDPLGNIYITEYGANKIRKITVSNGIITTIAGTGVGGKDAILDGSPLIARLNTPHGLTVDSSGNVFIADTSNHRIRKYNMFTESIVTIVGTGQGFSGDNGPAIDAQLNQPIDVALDSFGNIYIADSFNNRIRMVNMNTKIITTIAGTGVSEFSGDAGPAIDANLNKPRGVIIDLSGNILISDSGNHRIRKIDASTKKITTIAGTGESGFSGDTGSAIDAKLRNPVGLKLDSLGNIYIADYENNRIRKIDASTKKITTIAGTGQASSSGDDDLALNAKVNGPYQLSLDVQGNIYIVETSSNNIRKITVSTGKITKVAGTGSPGYTLGLAKNAQFNYPHGIAISSNGKIFVSDTNNHRIRCINTVMPAPSYFTSNILSNVCIAFSILFGVIYDSINTMHTQHYSEINVEEPAVTQPSTLTNCKNNYVQYNLAITTIINFMISATISLINNYKTLLTNIPTNVTIPSIYNTLDSNADVHILNIESRQKPFEFNQVSFSTKQDQIIHVYTLYLNTYNIVSLLRLYNIARRYIEDSELATDTVTMIQSINEGSSIESQNLIILYKNILSCITDKYYKLESIDAPVERVDISSSTTMNELKEIESIFLTNDNALWPEVMVKMKNLTVNYINTIYKPARDNAVTAGTLSTNDETYESDTTIQSDISSVENDSTLLSYYNTVANAFLQYKAFVDAIASLVRQPAYTAMTTFRTTKSTLSTCLPATLPSTVTDANTQSTPAGTGTDIKTSPDGLLVDQLTDATIIAPYTTKYNTATTDLYTTLRTAQITSVGNYKLLWDTYNRLQTDTTLVDYTSGLNTLASVTGISDNGDTDLQALNTLPTATPTQDNYTTLATSCTNYNPPTARYKTLLAFLKTNIEQFIQNFDAKYNALSQAAKTANPYTSPLTDRQLPASQTTDQELLRLMNSYAGYTPTTLTTADTSTTTVTPETTISFTGTYSTARQQADALTVLLDFNTLYSDLNRSQSLLIAIGTNQTDATAVTTLGTALSTYLTSNYATNLAKAVTDRETFVGYIGTALGLAQRNLQTIVTLYKNLHDAYTAFGADLSGVGVLPVLTTFDSSIAVPTTNTVPTLSYTAAATEDYTEDPVGSLSLYGSVTDYATFQQMRETYADGLITLISAVESNALTSFLGTAKATVTTLSDYSRSTGSNETLATYVEKSAEAQTQLTTASNTIAQWYVDRFYKDTFLAGVRYLSAADVSQTVTTFAATCKDLGSTRPTRALVRPAVTALQDITKALASSFETNRTGWTGRGMQTATTMPTTIATDKSEGSNTALSTYLGLWPTLMGEIKAFTQTRLQQASALQTWKSSRGNQQVTVAGQTTAGLA